MEHSPKLSGDQAFILLQKISKSFEEETGSMADEGKAKHRMELEDLCAARRTVQWWEPTGRQVLSQVLSPEDFKEAMGTVLGSNIVDQAISSRRLRQPKCLHRRHATIVGRSTGYKQHPG